MSWMHRPLFLDDTVNMNRKLFIKLKRTGDYSTGVIIIIGETVTIFTPMII